MAMKTIFAALGIFCLASQPALAQQQGYDVLIKNTCDSEMRIVIRYLTPSGSWHTGYWYTLAAGAQTYLSSSGARIRHATLEHGIGIYGETGDGRGMFGRPIGSDTGPERYVIKLNDSEYVLGRSADMTTREDDIYLRLHCNDR